ncbi:MAG: hypothetical protein AAF611_10930 [Bacteroidota bacterium]
MKKTILSLLTLFITLSAFAQAPELINYQAIIRSADGNLVLDSPIGMQISILQTSATGSAVYTETHTTTTNANGLVTIMIGGGTSADDFSAIDWSNGPYFIKTETDIAGGTNYTITGTSQLLSVPYALYAKNGTKFTETNEGLEYDGGNITLTQPGATIKLTSPNGTVYEIGVNDSGQLSLPTSGTTATVPTQLYAYGSFNGWDATTALQFGDYYQNYVGFKYFTAGTEIKFLAAQNEGVVYGGNSLSGILIENGNAFVIPANGFYKLEVDRYNLQYSITSINAVLNQNYTQNTTMQYDVANNFFYSTSDYSNILFRIGDIEFGDNLSDGILEVEGAIITNPFPAGWPTLYKVYLNFNLTGNYTAE